MIADERTESREVRGSKDNKQLGRIWSIRYWLAKLRDKKLIEAQIVFHLYVSRIHYPFKSYYHGANGSQCEFMSSSICSRHNHDKVPAKKADKARNKADRQKEIALFKLAPDADQWDWQGVPNLHPLARLYGYCSLFWMIYALIKSLFGVYGDQFPPGPETSGWQLMNLSAKCLFLGRLMFEPKLEALLARLFCPFHLIWRYVHRCMSRSYMLAPFIFLLQTEHDIEKFLKIMHANKHKNYITAPTSRPVDVSDRAKMPNYISIREHFNFYEQVLHHNKRLNGLIGQGVEQEQQRRQQEVSVHESFFRHIMCYEVHINDKIYYKLRPNRSWQSRNTLINHLAASTLISACWFLSMVIIYTTIVTILASADGNYARLYPDCSPELSGKLAQANSSRSDTWWSLSHLGTHRVLALIFDLAESLIIWTDSALAITYVQVLGYLLNDDILLYWRHMHARLEHIVAQVKLNRYKARGQFEGEHYSCQNRATAAGPGVTMWKSTKASKVGDNIVTICQTTRINRQSEAQLESDINDFQFEMIDFFCQVEKADKMVSDIITSTMSVWIITVAYVCYYWIRGRIELPALVTLSFAFSLIGLTVASKYLLKLNRCCLKSYKQISALMAYDQSDTKERFMKLLEFFTHRNRTTYTLFQRYPYTATSYITMASWSFSCYFIFYSLFRNSKELSFSRIL